MVGFIVLKKKVRIFVRLVGSVWTQWKLYLSSCCRPYGRYLGADLYFNEVLIGHGLSPQEIFLLRFLIAYMGIWLISPRKLFADNWKDEFWMFLGGMTGGSFYFLQKIQLWRLHWRRMCRLLSVRLRCSPPFFLCGFIKGKGYPWIDGWFFAGIGWCGIGGL